MEKEIINNDFYEELGEMWNCAHDHPIALLRAENRARLPWIFERLKKHCTSRASILDVACGGGLLSNELAKKGYQVTGVDLSSESLKVAERNDVTKKALYKVANAYELPFENEAFDAVMMMDFLEHVEDPRRAIQEAARVLKVGGLFFFHTFNRNLLSYFIIIKGVEWFVKNTPKNMHVYSLFLTPKEVADYAKEERLYLEEFYGLKPRISHSFLKLLMTRTVDSDFSFYFSRNLKTSYGGYFIKK